MTSDMVVLHTTGATGCGVQISNNTFLYLDKPPLSYLTLTWFSSLIPIYRIDDATISFLAAEQVTDLMYGQRDVLYP